MILHSTMLLLLAVLFQVAGTLPLTAKPPDGRSKFHILTELVNTTEFVTKARFHGKTVVPVMTGPTTGKLFVQRDPGPVACLNQTFSFDVNYLSFDVAVGSVAAPMTQPLVQPLIPSADSILDPVIVASYATTSSSSTSARSASLQAGLFHHNNAHDGIVPLSPDFINWVVCEHMDYSFQLLWLHEAPAVPLLPPGPLEQMQLPDECARVYLKVDERDGAEDAAEEG
ncbi:hypothetical protein IWX49DRAFT_553563 [Phyllosticta citricarpa]|uniref:Uncharacterized protein n=2 Tax=Phyllosticta TaxID=121621 RepID=A0ABR1LEB2_9PEZI